MATLEERVTQLEQDMQEIRYSEVSAGLRAQAYGLSLVQAEVADLRTEMRDGFGKVGEQFTAVNDRFAGVESTLAQILERLEQR